MSDKPRPVIGRVGGKVRLAPFVIAQLKRFDWSLYCEPFCGSCAVFFRLMAEGMIEDIKSRGDQPRFVLNDADSKVIQLFRIVRDNPDLLAFQTQYTPYSREEHRLAKSGEGLNDFEGLAKEIEIARRFLINSWQSFKKNPDDSWGVESNQRDQKNGVIVWEGIPDRIRLASEYFKKCYIENDDFEAVCKRWETPHSCFYFDPPYVNAEGYYEFNAGQGKDETLSLHYRLAELANTMTASCVAISYYPCELVEELYPVDRWEYHYKDVVASSAGVTRLSKNKTRPTRTELLLIRKNSSPREGTRKDFKGQLALF